MVEKYTLKEVIRESLVLEAQFILHSQKEEIREAMKVVRKLSTFKHYQNYLINQSIIRHITRRRLRIGWEALTPKEKSMLRDDILPSLNIMEEFYTKQLTN